MTRRSRYGCPDRTTGVTARLVALVVLPVLVLSGLVVSQVAPRWSTSTTALEVDHEVDELSALVQLHGAMESQRMLITFVHRIRESGADLDRASELIGVDLRAEAAQSRARAGSAFDVLGAASPVDRASTEGLFVDVDDPEWVPPTDHEIDVAEMPIASALAAQLRNVEEIIRRIGTSRLLAAIDTLRLLDRVLGAAAHQGVVLGRLWMPAPNQTAAGTAARLGAETTIYTSGIRRIRELGSPAIVSAIDVIEADPRLAAYNATITRALDGEPVGQAGGARRGQGRAVFRGYTLRASQLEDVVASAAEALRAEAQDLATSERTAFLGWVAAAAVLALWTLAVSIASARSISRPLRALADYAHAVNEGRLDADPTRQTRRGPREIRVAGAAFADLAANLQLLDAKANALATCAFDDPVLAQPLPGRLGRSLESSVSLLSSSIVERDRLQVHLTHQASHDSLTGIPNRTAALHGIQESLGRARDEHEAMALLFVDLNDFKSVNDRFGHEAGDEVLRQVADRVRLQLRDTDLVARLGGDELVVVVERIGDTDQALELAHRVIDTVTAPIAIGEDEVVTVGAAIGVALADDGAADDLLARADAAMYRAKRHGRSAIEIFDEDLARQVREREEVARALTVAVAEPGGGGLTLHYQPVLDAADGSVTGVEALVRWDRPGHGFLAPDAFVPIAEETSLIIDLDRWVLGAAASQLVAWSADPQLADVPIAVNISGRHLQSGRLRANIADVLGRTGVDPRRLSIEITETVLLDDLGAAAAELDAVRRLGIHVAIDDFGTGYTSLAHLQRLPIDTIKVDRSFTNELDVPRVRSLVRMVTEVGHAMDVAIVAEGVETDEELEVLRTLGADQLQGYLFSRPLPAEALVDWLRAGAAVRTAVA